MRVRRAGEEVGRTRLARGDVVRVMTLVGEAEAVVTSISVGEERAYAEDEFNVYPLQVEEGFWFCNSAWNKKAIKRITRESEKEPR